MFCFSEVLCALRADSLGAVIRDPENRFAKNALEKF